MPAITKEALQQLLEKCIATTVEEAQKQIADPLPTELYLGLEFLGQHGKELSVDEVMAFLYRDGTFPRGVDIAVRGVRDGRTFIWIRPSGHAYVSDFSQTWNTPTGMGPFKSIGLMLPFAAWKRSGPIPLQELKETGSKGW
jgi:hypothetical protein